MPNQIANDQKIKNVAAIEFMRNECEQVAALAESRADIEEGRFVKASPAAHVN